MEKKKSKYLVGSIICGILTAFGIVAGIISLLSGSGVWITNDIFQLVLSLLVGYYVCAGYKQPHGNLLRYIILLFAANIILGLRAAVQYGNTGIITLLAIRIGLLCYIAGRLVKVKQNLILMIIYTVLDVGLCIWQISSGVATIGLVMGPIIWIDICVAYFLRYQEHKEAGLSDVPVI